MRTNFAIFDIGTNRTGKSTFCNEIISQYNGRVLLITPDIKDKAFTSITELADANNLRYDGKKYLVYDDTTVFFEKVQNNFRNGLLVLDDAMYYMKNRKDENIRRLFMRRRQANQDIIFVAHGLTEIPPSLYTFNTHIVLHKTIDNISRAQGKLIFFDLLEQAQARVNAHSNPYYKEILNVR